MRRAITTAIALFLLLMIAVPASAKGNEGQAGKSDVYHCAFGQERGAYNSWGAWGKITIRDQDGAVSIVVTVHELGVHDPFAVNPFFHDSWVSSTNSAYSPPGSGNLNIRGEWSGDLIGLIDDGSWNGQFALRHMAGRKPFVLKTSADCLLPEG